MMHRAADEKSLYESCLLHTLLISAGTQYGRPCRRALNRDTRGGATTGLEIDVGVSIAPAGADFSTTLPSKAWDPEFLSPTDSFTLLGTTASACFIWRRSCPPSAETAATGLGGGRFAPLPRNPFFH